MSDSVWILIAWMSVNIVWSIGNWLWARWADGQADKAAEDLSRAQGYLEASLKMRESTAAILTAPEEEHE